MKTIAKKQMELQAMMAAARKTHAYKVETSIMEFTEELVRLMEDRGISKSELARKIGANPAYITKILRGTSNFTMDTLVKIATALDCEFRCHLQPGGHSTQWFDFLHEKPAQSCTAYNPGDYVNIDLSRVASGNGEPRPLAS